MEGLHTEFWENAKRILGIGSGHRLADVPGFAESLRDLIEVHGYSNTDIGLMFGVTRERVRQWRNICGIASTNDSNRASKIRVWDETRGLFVAIDADDWADRIIVARKARRAARREARREARRTEYVELVRKVGRRLRRVPCVCDVWPKTESGSADADLIYAARLFGAPPLKHGKAIDALWARAGYPERPDARRNRKYPPEFVEYVRKRYEAGATIAQLERDTPANWYTIKAIVTGTYTTGDDE